MNASLIAGNPRSFEAARIELARLHISSGSTLRDAWVKLSALAMDALQVDRIGVWVLIDEGKAARCRYLSQRSTADVFQGSILRAHDFPAYFRALEQQRVVAADDALNSPLTSELRHAYLEPMGITSMLDAALYEGGRMTGVVCHEHIGPARNWTTAECEFAMAVGDNISRIYQEHLRQNAESSARAYEDHLAELHRMEAIGRMAAGIAHDFRGIMSAAMGYAELCLRVQGLPRDAERYVRHIAKALERGNRLVQEVTTFGREEYTASPCVVDVRAIVQSMTPMFRVLAGDHIRCSFETDAPVGRVLMDASQLERALLNLVINARDAMSTGGQLTVRVQDEQKETEGGERETCVAISVVDNGVGMDAETTGKIFKPFFTTKGDNGTGLGLAIVDQVVSRAGGTIRFNSELGRGTTATLYLPRIAAALLPVELHSKSGATISLS